MTETRLTRALLGAAIFSLLFVAGVVILRAVSWLLGDDPRMWALVALVAVVGFALQWFADRPRE